MQQQHSGSGDNVGGDKIHRQTNLGDGGTYIEKYIAYSDRKIPHHITQNPDEANTDEFFGRKKELDDILFHFFPNQRKGFWFHLKRMWTFGRKQKSINSLKVLMLSGEGGIGKTTLAARYYMLNEKKYAHVAWVLNEPDFSRALLKLAKRVSLDLDEQDPIEENLNFLLADLAEFPSPSLLVVDNMDQLDDLQIGFPKLCNLYNFHVIITSRITDFNQTNTYQISGLAKDDVFDLFKKYYPALLREEKSLLIQIRDAVGDNTLVLELLSKNLAVINKHSTNYTLVNLLEDLQQKGLLQLSRSSWIYTLYHGHGKLRHEKPKDIIAAMYNLSDLNVAETSLLSAFSVLPAAELVTLDLLNKLYEGLPELETYLYTLTQKGWLEFVAFNSSYKCSPVIRDVVRHINNNLREDCQAFIDRLIFLLDYQSGGHFLNASYKEALIYTRYGESILTFFQESEYDLYILCDRLGNCHITTGNLNSALLFFEQAVNICQSLLEFNSENADYKFGLAISYKRIGDTHMQLGDLDYVLTIDTVFNNIILELFGANPLNADYKHELAISYERLGSTHTSLGDLDKALGFYEDCNSLQKELYAAYPNNVNFKSSLAISYEKLGRTHASLGNLDKALGYYVDNNRLEKELYAAYPNNVDFKNELAISYFFLGRTHESLGNLDKALGYYVDNNRLEIELYTAYPNNMDFKCNLAISYERLGSTHTSLGNLDKALEFYKVEVKLFEELYATNQTNVNFKNGLAISNEKLGKTHTALDDLDKAWSFYEVGVKLFEELYTAYPNNVDFKNGLAISYSNLGNTHAELSNLDMALSFYKEYKRLEEELYAAYPNNVFFKNSLALSYQTLGWFFENKNDDKKKQEAIIKPQKNC